MPFTPYHMGPGLPLKAVLGGSFSLMVFGWTQIVTDLEPLAFPLSSSPETWPAGAGDRRLPNQSIVLGV